MKRKMITIAVWLLVVTAGRAQDSLRLEFDVNFNDDFDRGRNERMHKATLLVQGNRTQYYMVSRTTYRKTNDDDHVFSPDTTMMVYTDQSDGLMLVKEYGIDGLPFIISDSLYPMQWEITGEEKKFGEYPCVKAKCRFRGREYIAWFVPDLPLPYGPWKMGGLPGLIVDLQDAEANLVVKLSSISKAGGNIVLPSPVRYTMAEHIAEYQRLLAKLRAGSRANGSGDCLTCTGHSTYTFYFWEKLPQ